MSPSTPPGVSLRDEVLACLRQAGGEFVVELRGGSMRPTLADGEKLVVAPDASIRIGDLVAFLGPDGSIWIHRALLPSQDEAGHRLWRTRGDGNRGVDPPVPIDRIIGRVVGRRTESGDLAFSRIGAILRLVRFHVLPLLFLRLFGRRPEVSLA